MNYKSTFLIFVFSLYSLCFSNNDTAFSNLQVSFSAGKYSVEEKSSSNSLPMQMNVNYQTEMPDTEKYEPRKDNTDKIVLGIFCGIGCIFVTVVVCAVLFSALSFKGDIM